MKPELWQKTQTSVGFKVPPVNPVWGLEKSERRGQAHTGSASQSPGTRRTAQWPENSASSCGRGEPLDPPTCGSRTNTLFSAQPKALAAAPTNQRERMRGWQGRRKAAPAPRYLIRAATLMAGAVRVRAAGEGGSREVAAAAAAAAAVTRPGASRGCSPLRLSAAGRCDPCDCLQVAWPGRIRQISTLSL